MLLWSRFTSHFHSVDQRPGLNALYCRSILHCAIKPLEIGLPVGYPEAEKWDYLKSFEEKKEPR